MSIAMQESSVFFIEDSEKIVYLEFSLTPI